MEEFSASLMTVLIHVQVQHLQKIIEKLENNYNKISEYMDANRLKLNGDKIHLMLMMNDQARRSNPDIKISLKIENEIIETSETEKMLGGFIHQNLKWTEHIQNNKESLIRSLTTRLHALYKICHISNFKTRKMIAEGIFSSKLIYLMPLWGGCELYLISSLQTIQNKAARAVTKLGWYTTTEELLKQCGWLSVNQLIVYHTLILVYKVISNKSPVYLHNKITTEFAYPTRMWTHFKDGNIDTNLRVRPNQDTSHLITSRSFRWRSSKLWNALPVELRHCKSLDNFKSTLKTWIKQNVPIKISKDSENCQAIPMT